MAELSDYQISQITENIKRFNETYKLLIKGRNYNAIKNDSWTIPTHKEINY